MKISIITPCLNSEKSISRAVESVLTQSYRNWEHIIIDGAPADNTVAILSAYPHLKLISERDGGQADAMNKGIALATGDIIGFLNADDYYFPDAFSSVIEAFDDQTDFVVGNVLVKSRRLDAEFLNTPRVSLEGMMRHWEPNAFCHNPVGYFYRSTVQKQCPFNPHNHATMDLEFLLSAAAVCKLKKIEVTLGCFEDSYDTKTDQTQLRPDYWRESTFSYIGQYLNKFDDAERAKYEKDRREGYAHQQADSNRRLRNRGQKLTIQGGHPKVSIVIPTYNDADTLSDSIDSVLRQSYNNIEIIVIDDHGEEDASEFIANKYSSTLPIRVHRHSENKMAGSARNTGIELAAGSFIYFLDSDDELMEDAIERLLAIATTCRVDVVQGGTLRKSLGGHVTLFHQADFCSDGGLDGLELFATHQYASVVWNKLYNMELLKSPHKPRFPQKFMHEDVSFSLKTAFLANGIVSVSDPVIYYRENPPSLTLRQPTHFNIGSYISAYLDLISSLNGFGLLDDKYRLLIQRILTAHVTSDFGAKLINCYAKMPLMEFSDAVLSAGWENFGVHGMAVADLLMFLLRDIEELRRNKKETSRLRLKSGKRASLMENLRSLYALSKMLVR